MSKQGRVFSIGIVTSEQSVNCKYWVTIFRTQGGYSLDEMKPRFHYITSRASVARVRRAQDRLMEGKHE